ncbi:hypothetical protein K435DRAFT_725354 [Dendrothele bispora CBS 962.96]|uniref:PX-domain-containing protein n=1 Tax=Dendrothele bispora (strain CBS 962.96) TaxID=1314807 RepID=A0A4S8LVC3_DENBC|nr:hypothetical protein K435DRAFT_725354 [Dendrothele bispora CBS 962.96]
MATLPRASKSPSSSAFLTFSRPQSDFDAGINASNAWTQHRVLSNNITEDELARGKEMVAEIEAESASIDGFDQEEKEEEKQRPARALYDFEGKPEFQELSVLAGDDIQIVKEDLADGWSLVSNSSGEVGLLPRDYYTFTSDFVVSQDLDITPSSSRITTRERPEVNTSNTTPRNSTHSLVSPLNPLPPAHPIFPQRTGDWIFPSRSFRQSILGGKSLNRFSSFVTSGAEAWVLQGSGSDSTPVPPGGGSGRDRPESVDLAGGTHRRYPTLMHEKLSSIASDEAGEEAEEEAEKASEEPEGSGSGAEDLGKDLAESDKHFVDAGHAWKSKLPPFRVLVHSPSKRTSVLTGAYTVYNVTSLFEAPVPPDYDPETSGPPPSPTRLTVQRRYSHFVLMHTALTRRLPGIALPPLPEKQYAGRFNQDFVEARRGDLERYIDRVVRHPVARYAEVVTWFLGCESESEWKRLAPYYLAQPPAGPSFYAHVFHPAFNLDLEDAEEAVERFAVHTKALGRGVQGLRSVFGKIREARVEMSKAERLLSYSLFSLITSKPLASSGGGQVSGIAEEDDDDEDQYPNNVNGTVKGYSPNKHKGKGMMNRDGAWCWREGCEECLALTKAMQRTADSLRSVADMYDDHARRTQLATHESLKSVAHPATVYDGVISTHRSTLTRYRDIDAGADSRDEEIAARCETVLNTTMAEMETYHSQKVEDFATIAKEHLDGEIALYEQILVRLRSARSAFDLAPESEVADSPSGLSSGLSHSTSRIHDSTSLTPILSGPRQPSIYERELENPRLTTDPLPQPTPHVFDSTPVGRGVGSVVGRPVSVAVGSLLGSGGTTGRGSVFGNLFW